MLNNPDVEAQTWHKLYKRVPQIWLIGMLFQDKITFTNKLFNISTCSSSQCQKIV